MCFREKKTGFNESWKGFREILFSTTEFAKPHEVYFERWQVVCKYEKETDFVDSQRKTANDTPYSIQMGGYFNYQTLIVSSLIVVFFLFKYLINETGQKYCNFGNVCFRKEACFLNFSKCTRFIVCLEIFSSIFFCNNIKQLLSVGTVGIEANTITVRVFSDNFVFHKFRRWQLQIQSFLLRM